MFTELDIHRKNAGKTDEKYNIGDCHIDGNGGKGTDGDAHRACGGRGTQPYRACHGELRGAGQGGNDKPKGLSLIHI